MCGGGGGVERVGWVTDFLYQKVFKKIKKVNHKRQLCFRFTMYWFIPRAVIRVLHCLGWIVMHLG